MPAVKDPLERAELVALHSILACLWDKGQRRLRKKHKIKPVFVQNTLDTFEENGS